MSIWGFNAGFSMHTLLICGCLYGRLYHTAAFCCRWTGVDLAVGTVMLKCMKAAAICSTGLCPDYFKKRVDDDYC